ncbi:MAG: prolipoprotein diacylglyceryl transferase [Candidatus Omnitrophica bacterium]|nr:prolipoprotein diacylglyceryl transferase [Candidatus Omnitrophota bacterium]
MFPEPLVFFGFPIYLFGIFASFSILLGYVIVSRDMERLGIGTDILPDFALAMLLPSFLIARLTFVLLHWDLYASSPIDFFKLGEGGLALSGGLIGGAAGAYVFCLIKRLPPGRVADATAPGLSLGLAVSRLGCWFAGCCYGKPTDLPWAVKFQNLLAVARPLEIPLHPTQIYAFLIGLGIFALLMFLRSRTTFRGEVMLVFLIMVSGTRMFLDLYRSDAQLYMTLLMLLIFTFSLIRYVQLKLKQRSFVMSRPRLGLSVLLITAVLFAACGIIKTDKLSRGHDILQGDVDAIVNGVTKEKEILKLFGPPTKIRDTEEGQEFMYEYAKSGGPRWDLVVNVGGSTKTKTLLIWIDKNGVVTDHAFKST